MKKPYDRAECRRLTVWLVRRIIYMLTLGQDQQNALTISPEIVRLDSGRFAQGFPKTSPIRQSDPFILLLLAEQELNEGRKEQAMYLVEAAYEAYDQPREAHVYRIRPVG